MPLNVRLFPAREMPVAVVAFNAPLKVDVPEPTSCEIEPAKMLWVDTVAACRMLNTVSGVPRVPTLPPSVIVPVSARSDRDWLPVIALEKVMLELTGLAVMATTAVRLTAPAKEMLPFVEVIAPPKFTAPPPLCE